MLNVIHVKTNPNLGSNVFKKFLHQITTLGGSSLAPTIIIIIINIKSFMSITQAFETFYVACLFF